MLFFECFWYLVQNNQLKSKKNPKYCYVKVHFKVFDFLVPWNTCPLWMKSCVRPWVVVLLLISQFLPFSSVHLHWNTIGKICNGLHKFFFYIFTKLEVCFLLFFNFSSISEHFQFNSSSYLLYTHNYLVFKMSLHLSLQWAFMNLSKIRG